MAGYNNFGNPYYNFAPTAYQPQPQPQRPQAFNEVLYATADEARAYIIQPNQSVMLIDTQNGVFRIKSADNLGNSSTRTYKFAEIKEGDALTGTKYVTLEEFNSRIEELNKKIKEMTI